MTSWSMGFSFWTDPVWDASDKTTHIYLKGATVSASKAAAIIRILSTPRDRDPRFIEYVTAKITRGGPHAQEDYHLQEPLH